MQNNFYINKIISGYTFEELGEILQGRITELKEAYKIRRDDYAKNLRTSIDSLIEESEKKAKLSGQKEKLQKQTRRYTLLINIGKILGGRELDQILGDTPQQYKKNKLEEEILELREEGVIDDSNTAKALRVPVETEITPTVEPYDYYTYISKNSGELSGTIKRVKRTFTRKEFCNNKLKQLRKEYYETGKLNKKGAKNLRNELEEAKKKGVEFKDLELSFKFFMKNFR